VVHDALKKLGIFNQSRDHSGGSRIFARGFLVKQKFNACVDNHRHAKHRGSGTCPAKKFLKNRSEKLDIWSIF